MFVLAQSGAMQRKFLFPSIALHIYKQQQTVLHSAANGNPPLHFCEFALDQSQ